MFVLRTYIQAAGHFGVRTNVESAEVEDGEQVAVARSAARWARNA
jgi:hypothetical protein